MNRFFSLFVLGLIVVMAMSCAAPPSSTTSAQTAEFKANEVKLSAEKVELSGNFGSAAPSGDVAEETALDVSGTYELNTKCSTSPYLTLNKITVDENGTALEFTYEGNDAWIGVNPPGNDDAFYLLDSVTGKKYTLVNVEGIELLPLKTQVDKETPVTFTMTFEKLQTRKFHCFEGYDNGTEASVWYFKNLTLE